MADVGHGRGAMRLPLRPDRGAKVVASDPTTLRWLLPLQNHARNSLVPRHPKDQWRVAQASPDFFDVLHLPVRLTEGVSRMPDRVPKVLLGEDTWIRDFGGRPNLAGAKLHVGSVDAVVAGVAFGASMGLPGNVNAWLLGPDPPARKATSEYV